MYLLVLVGDGGFFAAALSATGIIKLPSSYEWPAGYVRGVVTTADGKYRGNFKVQCSANGVIEVFTARGEHHYSFAQDGHLIGSESLPEPFSSLPDEGQSVVVPTSPLLWIFSSPFLSWGVAVVGFVGLAVLKKMGHRSGFGS